MTTTTEQSTPILDTLSILEVTRNAPRDKALKFREELRHLLRALEDMHDFPYSFQTKAERPQELEQRGLHGATPKTGHHNR